MSEGTTKSNDSREMKVEEAIDVEKRIEAAGYNVKINALQAQFSKEKVQVGEEGNTSGSTDSTKTSKAGKHTLVGNKVTIAFKPLIPFIANGAKAKLRGKGKENKSNEKDINEK